MMLQKYAILLTLFIFYCNLQYYLVYKYPLYYKYLVYK